MLISGLHGRVYPSKQQALGAFGREISCFSKTTAKKLGTNTLLVPNLKVGVPVSPGPYGCCAYAGTYKISRCAGCLHFVKLHKTLLTPTQKKLELFLSSRTREFAKYMLVYH